MARVSWSHRTSAPRRFLLKLARIIPVLLLFPPIPWLLPNFISKFHLAIFGVASGHVQARQSPELKRGSKKAGECVTVESLSALSDSRAGRQVGSPNWRHTFLGPHRRSWSSGYSSPYKVHWYHPGKVNRADRKSMVIEDEGQGRRFFVLIKGRSFPSRLPFVAGVGEAPLSH